MRDTARIASIAELTGGEYVVQEGWLPNYVQTDYRRLTRLNLMGLVVEKDSLYSFVLDDGTGSILVTDFGQLPATRDLKIGMPVLVIGKPRKTGEDIFIAAEIIKSTQLQRNPGFLIERKQILKQFYTTATKVQRLPPSVSRKKDIISGNFTDESTATSPAVDELIIPPSSPAVPITGEDILDFIRSKDGGDGCAIDEIYDYFGKDIEEHVTTLITMGEIFEIRPGFVKVLD